MNKILETLQEELEQLRGILSRTSERLKSVPDGKLEISKENNHTVYRQSFPRKNGEKRKQRIYLSNKEEALIRALVQKSFDEKVFQAASKQEHAISSFLNTYDPDALRNIYANLSPERKAIVIADILDNKTVIENWLSVQYSPNMDPEPSGEFFTSRNEHVRSKSELIIANTLFQREIPYRYEPPLKIIPGKKNWHPDFQVMNPNTLRVYIWEHLGMMDDPDYCNKNIEKIHAYQKAGIFPGDNLIITMETSTKPLSTKEIKLIIEQYLE